MTAEAAKRGPRALKLFSKDPAERAHFVEWLAEALGLGDTFLPRSRNDLGALLERVRERTQMFDTDAQAMLEGVLRISEITVRDVMIPKAEMTSLHKGDSFAAAVAVVAEEGHSRYPVFDGEKVVGVLLAKDLLRYSSDPGSFRIEEVMREPMLEPMAKPLDQMLHGFKGSKNHMVIVIDEYGAHSGLVTIEDVLERIVGSISDEHDEEEEENVVVLAPDRHWRVNGLMTLKEFNRKFGAGLSEEDVATLGGWVASHFGTIPQKGETVRAEGLELSVHNADSRRVLEVEVRRIEGAPGAQPEAQPDAPAPS